MLAYFVCMYYKVYFNNFCMSSQQVVSQILVLLRNNFPGNKYSIFLNIFYTKKCR
ncbi:MAG: hypothetical protein Pg6B_03790 [Candidatus Azobacteroides pseudotrichonymphae]|nr:MAG: hypothetical protein Pg6B_03790 [Candidatus Azobacteroides pseudotrichonymphae]